MSGHRYWIQANVQIHQEGAPPATMTVSLGLELERAITSFDHVAALGQSISQLIREQHKIPPTVPVGVMILGFQKLETEQLIIPASKLVN